MKLVRPLGPYSDKAAGAFAAAGPDVRHVPQNRPQRVVFKAPLLTRWVMIDSTLSSTDVFLDVGKSEQKSLENS